MDRVKWQTDFDHAGELTISEHATMAQKIAAAWDDHKAKFPDCTLCDLMTVEEDFV